MTAILVADKEHWNTLRSKHIGGSEISALWGEHPNISRFDLWQRKKGNVAAPDLSNNDRVFWGSVLEPAIGEGVRLKTGWTIRKVHVYHSMLPWLGAGCSADYEIVSHPNGPGVLSIKAVDWLVAKQWEGDEPPVSHMLQVQHELLCTGRAWGCIAVLVGGNELRLFEFERRSQTIDLIKTAVAEFWQSIADNKPPPPDFARDGATLARLYASVEPGKTVDLSSSNRLPDLIAEYRRAGAEQRAGEAAKQAAKAEMLTLIGDAEKVVCGGATISAKTVAGVAIAYHRADYRDFRVHEKKVKADV